jgi:excisionase family DNA binding protein
MRLIDDKILKADEVSKMLGVSRKAIYRLCKKGKFVAFKIGCGRVKPRGLRIMESSVLKFIESKKT